MINKTRCARSCACALVALGAVGAAQATTIEAWNRDNVITDLPPHFDGVTYDSKLFTDTGRTTSYGAVIWKEGAVIAPGADVLTDSPGPGNNCIITSGTNRAVPGAVPKTCTDEFQSAKRVKLEARAPGTGIVLPDVPDDTSERIILTDDTPLDMVFDVSQADLEARTYRVFKKYINATGERTDGFVVQLGFGTGDAFSPSSAGDGLRFTRRKQGQNPNPNDFDPLPFYSTPPGNADLGSLMSAGLFGDAADNQNRTIDGYFFLPEPIVPDENGQDCATDPSGTGRSYYNLVVRNEDRIETVGDVQGLHECLFGNMLPQGELPLGFFWDDDGDAVTDADTIADWNGSFWQTYVLLDVDPASPTYGDPILTAEGNFTRPDNPPVPVPQHVIDYWLANPDTGDGVTQFYFIAPLDDMGLVNNNYHITVERIQNWPTYDPDTNTASFTMRTSNVGEGTPFSAPWLATLPPELDPPPAPADLAIAAFTVAGSSPSATVDEDAVVPVTVQVENQTGSGLASGRVVGEAMGPDGKLIGAFLGVVTDLPAGASLPFTFEWTVADPTGLPDNLTWTAEVIPDGEELDPSDNTAAVTVSINLAQPPALPVDVAITKLRVPPVAKSGRSYKIQLQIANDRDAEGAASGVVDVFANGAQVASLSFANLAPRRRANLDFEWLAPDVADGSLTVEWMAVVTAPGDTEPTNDTATARTEVTAGRGRR